MIKNRAIIRATAAIGMVSVILSGCEKTQKESKGQEQQVQNETLAADLEKKYGSSEKYEYSDPINELGRDESLFLTIDFDPVEKGMENFTEIVQVFQDPELTQPVGTYFDLDEEESEIEVKPPKYVPLSISNYGLDDDEYGMEDSEYTLFEKEECKDWGNLGKMYMAQWVDLKTGEKLAKPIVTVVTVAGEVGTPNIRFTETDDGLAAFTWDEVKGAKKYFIGEIDYSKEKGLNGTVRIIGETEDTSWESEHKKGDVVFNSSFTTYSVSQDDWNDPSESMQTYLREEYGTENVGKIIKKSEDSDVYYGVFAVSEEGTSMVSNTYSRDELASLLVRSEALFSGDEKSTNYAKNGITSASSHRWVVMCDGRVVQKLIEYDYDKAKATERTYGTYEKEDMSDMKATKVEVVEIPYTVEGTALEGLMIVENYDEKTLDKDLASLKERQEGLRNKTGNVEVEIEKGEKAEEKEPKESKEQQAAPEIGVTANSALSEYLAVKLLAGSEAINLEPFKRSSDEEYLIDAFQEARYQNPLILGIANAGISGDGKYLYIEYEDEPKEREKKQTEILEAVEKVVDEIITDDMSDLEKEFAINQYLCDNAEYDTAALENAEQYDYLEVDEEFNDSFTPYGILVKQIGVCASYSGSFKLLADAAGLDSIVVTGYLDGSLAHAWNRVNIDGQWQTLDVTNNDMPDISNALLNLPDNAASAALIQDDVFAMNDSLEKYSAEGSENEYYRTEAKYFDQEQIVEALVQEMNKEGKVTLRTDYELNDAIFAEIAEAVMEQAERTPSQGYYWLGVIYLSE